MLPINPILAAAAADMLVGMVWYSDYAFGPMWKKIHGKPNTEKDMIRRLAIQVVASVMLATSLYMAIMTFQKAQVSYGHEMFTQMFSWLLDDRMNTDLMSAMKTAAFVWLGFFFAPRLSCAAWGSGQVWHKLAIKSGAHLAGLLAMAAVLATLA